MKKESLVLLLCLIVEYALAETLQLFSATTFIDTPSVILTGSLRGGRTVYIEGVGFPNDPNQIQVWIGPYPCLIPADGSTPIAITCVTTDTSSPVDVRGYPITVISQKSAYTVPLATFNYLYGDTPQLNSVFPSASIAATRLYFFGIHRVLSVGDGQRNMGDFIGLYVGDAICSMFDIYQDYLTYNDYGKAQCDQSTLQ